MNTKVFVKLEFDKILKMLANKALSDSGKREAVSLKPSKSISAVTRLQSETLEAESTLMRSAKTPMSGFSDISSETSRLKAGADLSCRELLRILGVLKSARRAKRGLVKVEGSTNLLPHMAEQLYYDDGMITELDDAIMSDSELADTASHELFNIRKRIMRENEGIREKLNAVIRSSHHKEHLQDAIVTMRSGRYVVPVKQEFKRNIKGLVHDQSASGQTVFIEPMEVVEANNKLRELELAEREEVERILHVFSERLREFWSELKNNLNILTRLDVIFAKAALASTMKASPVTITDEKKIIIKNGRHPLIDAKEVVPVSLHIDEGYSGLIITGPNTGGKTVTLKLTGLLALMAQSGLFVPADSGTTMPVFKAIFADIGDEQSIEQSLSTFSSHMNNITRITNMADSKSLVLLDELGAGTDPAEGAALAMSILEELAFAKSFVMATTHYSEIKAFAMASDIYQNACMEFSVRTLSPTYRLIMGVPGVSNAFEISKKLGLNEQIIDRAREHMSEETVKFEQLIGEAERQREMAERKEQQAEGFRRTAQSIKDKSDKELVKAQEKRKIIIEKANEKALDILKDAKDEAERIIAELKLSKSAKQEEINAARKVLNDKIDKTASSLHQKEKKKSSVTADQIGVGDTVTLINHGVKATVLKAPKDGKVFVQAGVVKMSVALSEVEVAAKEKQISRLGGFKRDMSQPVSMEVDLRGLSLDEAVMQTDKFLDESFIAGRGEISIIHGKGTGVLRAGIRDFLRTHPHADKYREGKYGEGEAGVTIVTIK
ncbi:MAG: endonuclease MutS2 [Clostridia bacterium]|jgi:DNA mismatch repair protein MutS2|nr:endonuclease MutS2 [Clostridia bacterium]